MADQPLYIFGETTKEIWMHNMKKPKKQKRLTKDQKIILQQRKDNDVLKQEIMLREHKVYNLAQSLAHSQNEIAQNKAKQDTISNKLDELYRKTGHALKVLENIPANNMQAATLERGIGIAEGILACALEIFNNQSTVNCCDEKN